VNRDQISKFKPASAVAENSMHELLPSSLTMGQKRHLLFGRVNPPEQGYADFESYKAAWRIHGDVLSAAIAKCPGLRAAAWFAIDCSPVSIDPSGDPLHFGRLIPSPDEMPLILWDMGQLSADELEAIEAAVES
jgi:hypothetical protein